MGDGRAALGLKSLVELLWLLSFGGSVPAVGKVIDKMISRCRAAALRWRLQDDIIFQHARSSPYSLMMTFEMHRPI